MYNSERQGGRWYEAWAALLDLGDEVLPLVMEQFRSVDEVQRIRAARLLDHGMGSGGRRPSHGRSAPAWLAR
jgi:hypothetical protein